MNPHISDEVLLEIAKQLGANIDWGGYGVIYHSDTYNKYGLAMSASPAAVGGFVISREEYEERIKLLIDQHMDASCSKCEGLEHSYNLDADNECQTCQVERKELMPILYEQFGDNPTWHNNDIKDSVILNCTKDTFSSKLGHIKKGDYVLGGLGFVKDYFNLVCTRKQYLDYVKSLKLSEDDEYVLESKQRKHSHYFKDVSELDEEDVYQVCHTFQVQDFSGCKHHSIKKLLLSGGRGVKDEYKDVSEARDTLNRWLEINKPK